MHSNKDVDIPPFVLQMVPTTGPTEARLTSTMKSGPEKEACLVECKSIFCPGRCG
jgi:hypothetical protein